MGDGNRKKEELFRVSKQKEATFFQGIKENIGLLSQFSVFCFAGNCFGYFRLPRLREICDVGIWGKRGCLSNLLLLGGKISASACVRASERLRVCEDA